MFKYFKIHADLKSILFIFITWRVFLLLVMFVAISSIPLAYQDRYLGGGSLLYNISPQLFSWANFDGEHYLSIAIFGYKMLEQAFFPIYPLVISFFAQPFSSDLVSSLVTFTLVGLIISNACFLFSLIFLWKLIKIDYPKKIAYLTIIVLLCFPTAFYFGSLYNEGLFLLLSVLSFISVRKGNFFLAGILGLLASATRVFGILLLPAFLIEAYQQRASPAKFFWIFLIPLGLGAYMLYQHLTFEDAFAFYNLQEVVGQQHQKGIIILPQVYFRYIKMLLTVGVQNPIYQTIVLEFLTGILFFILPLIGFFKKVRLSYLFYAMVGFLMPTIQGSFSSSPRYILVLFPSFLILALLIDRLPKLFRISILVISILALAVETSLFLRGFWVA